MMERLSVDQIEEGHGAAFTKALVMDLRERRERVLTRLSEAGWGSVEPSGLAARCGRLAAYDEIIALIIDAKGKETET